MSDILGTLSAWSPELLGPSDTAVIPASWRPIVDADDPVVRRTTALSLWNDGILDRLPRFAPMFRDRLADVRVGAVDGVPVLIYVVTGIHESVITWIGFDPRSFGDEPRFWDSFPAAVRVFLRETHAGFMSRGPDQFGIGRPSEMETLAESADSPDGVEDWDETHDIGSTRLLIVAREGELMRYCVSPDAEPDHLIEVYEGDAYPRLIWECLDALLMLRFEVS